MYDEILRDASFVQALVEFDRELLREAQKRGWPSCGGKLDVAHFPRKPRGGPWDLDDAQCLRLSVCCRREGCRRRVTPGSVRFLGRRVYLGVIVVLAGVLGQGPAPWRVRKLTRELGADRRTLLRWRRWWTERIGKSQPFVVGRGEFMPPPDGRDLPGTLLQCFVGTAAERMIRLLRWLAERFGSRWMMEGGGHAEVAR